MPTNAGRSPQNTPDETREALQRSLDPCQVSEDVQLAGLGRIRHVFGEYPKSIKPLSYTQCSLMSMSSTLTEVAFIYTGLAYVSITDTHQVASCIQFSCILIRAQVLMLTKSQQARRTDLESRTLWALTGAANRMAHSIGLHQDGTDLGLPLFETEMRRRLWWQVLWLELRSAERTGSGQVTQFFMYDIRKPRNVDDDDFWPGQTEAELEKVIQERGGENRATEMINLLALSESALFWREQMMSNPDIFHWQRGPLSPFAPGSQAPQQMKPWEMDIAHRDTVLDELQRRQEDKYIRYCDPSVPQQLLASIHIRASGAYMRLMTYHPRRWGSSPSAIPPDQRALLWRLAMRILDLDNMQRTTPALQRFIWRATDYFQWQALVYALQELASEPTGERADEGFARVHESFHCHPSLVSDRNSLHKALCSLALKAWDARVAALRGQEKAAEEAPPYMEKLLQRRAAAASRVPAGGGEKASQQKVAATTTGQDHTMSFDPGTSTHTTEPAPVAASNPNGDPFMGGGGETQQDMFMDWETWDKLIQDFQAAGGEDSLGDMLDLSI